MKNSFRKALVTGAAGELGSQICRSLATLGVDLVVSDMDGARLQALAEELDGYPDCSAEACAVDLNDHAALEVRLRHLVEEHPDIDLVVSNAGIDRPQRIDELDWRVVRQHFDVHVLANYVLFAVFVPHFAAQGRGHITTVISLGGLMGAPYEHAYNGSKAALRMLVDGVRAETRGRGPTFTSVFPGFLAGRMAEGNAYRVHGAVPMRIAAERIVEATLAGKAMLRFPLRMWLLTCLARMLPVVLRDRATRDITES